MISVSIYVVTELDGKIVGEQNGINCSWEGTTMVDFEALKKKRKMESDPRFGGLNSGGPAEVSVGLEEKISGPARSYSSVTVSVRLSVRCDQAEGAIRGAQNLLFDEARRALESFVRPSLEQLELHLEKYRHDE